MEEVKERDPEGVKKVVEKWLARAKNPSSRLEAELKKAKEKIMQLEHVIEEDKKFSQIKQQEDKIQLEKHERVIMMMAREIQNLNEGKEPELVIQKEIDIENEELSEKLEITLKENEEMTKTINILKKVVDSVNEMKKPAQNKKKIQCKNINKPEGCPWGTKCRFDHGDEHGLEKKPDCSFWMDGHCRFSDKVCWNMHDPSKKGSKSKKSQTVSKEVFQEGLEEQGLPPKDHNSASRMEGQEWITPMSRKTKRRMKATTPEKEIQVASIQEKEVEKTARTNPLAGADGQGTPTFPLDGESSQQILVQVLAAILQQAGLGK